MQQKHNFYNGVYSFDDDEASIHRNDLNFDYHEAGLRSYLENFVYPNEISIDKTKFPSNEPHRHSDQPHRHSA